MRALFALIASMFIAVGCATTPVGKYNEMNESYIATVNTVVNARANGLIEDSDWQDVLVVINEGNEVLRQMREVTDAGGDPTDLQVLLDIALVRLAQYLEDIP